MKKIIIFFALMLCATTYAQNYKFSNPKISTYEPRGYEYFSKPNKIKFFVKLVEEIVKQDWEYTDSLDANNSSFINDGFYYSDYSRSFLILQMNSEYYLYKDVTMTVWEGFKKSYSKGEFYNSYIRGNYLIFSTE